LDVNGCSPVKAEGSFIRLEVLHGGIEIKYFHYWYNFSVLKYLNFWSSKPRVRNRIPYGSVLNKNSRSGSAMIGTLYFAGHWVCGGGALISHLGR
jgi:hypothetical protein